VVHKCSRYTPCCCRNDDCCM